jgi:hypothetical protein
MKVWDENNWQLRLRSIGALGALIKGNNLVMKRDFIDNGGFNFLIKNLKETVGEPPSETDAKFRAQTITKMLSLMDDLLKFEKFMNREIDFMENEMDLNKLSLK